MKIQITALLLMAGLLALLNVPAAAQEQTKSPSEEVKKPEPPRENVRPLDPRSADEKMMPYLGVLTGPASRELRAQFNLAEGFGLQVLEVMPDSPAKAAGLKEYDVLIMFEDQKLVNMEQLQTLVRAKKKEDQITLSVITNGQTKPVSIKIGERLTTVHHERPRDFGLGFPPNMKRYDGDMNQWRNSAEDSQNQMREYQKQMQDRGKTGDRGQMPQPPMFKGPGGRGGDNRDNQRDGEHRHNGGPDSPKGETQRGEHRESHESANITRSDDSGIYSLRRVDGRTVFTAKPKDGEEKSWPVNTDEERASVPEQHRSKLQEMNEIRSNVRREEGHQENKNPPPAAKPADGI